MLKRTLSAVSLLLISAPFTSYASEQLVPAGSLIQCLVSEAKISSKTTAIGDPVLCKLSHVELHGRSVLPYNSYLVGHFEAYKDPGHFVGKGWMELRFDHMVIEPDTEIPIDARVVEVPKYNVDRDGKILGNGHPVKDTVEWLIPVLWPIDLINLPRRGPRPVLKPETRLTLKLMDDLGIPGPDDYPRNQQAALIERNPPPQYVPTPQPQYAPQQSYAPQYAQQQYTQPPQQIILNNYNSQPPMAYNPPQQQQQTVVVSQPQPQVIYHYPPPAPRVYVPYGYGYPPPVYHYGYGPGY